jgi:hypothetical protein
MRRTLLASILALALGATAAPAQEPAAPARIAGAKSPTAARLIGIIPGAGHMYAGETGRGFTYMGVVVGAFALMSLALVAECYDDLLGTEDNCGNSTTEDVAAAVVIGVWAWTIYDAGRAAHRTNEKRRFRVSLLAAPVRVAASPRRESRGLKLGLSLSAR